MTNKTDPYVDFDPTQTQLDSACCGGVGFNPLTGEWEVRPRQPTCEEKLEQANADKADAEAKLAESEQAKTDAETKLAESEQAKEQALADKATAEQERDDAKAKLAECEKKPTCEAVPVYSIGGALVFNGYSCGDSTVTSLGGDNVAGIDPPVDLEVPGHENIIEGTPY